MMIAILIAVLVVGGIVIVDMGFRWDDRELLQVTAKRTVLTRLEVTAYKEEILHHINHLTVRKRPSERAKEQEKIGH